MDGRCQAHCVGRRRRNYAHRVLAGSGTQSPHSVSSQHPNLGRIVEVLVGTKTPVNDDRSSKFFLGDAVNSLSARFILQYCSTRHELLSFGGLIFAFAQENTAIIFDDEVNRNEWNILYDCLYLDGGIGFSSAGIVSPSSTRRFVRDPLRTSIPVPSRVLRFSLFRVRSAGRDRLGPQQTRSDCHLPRQRPESLQ